MNTHNFAKPLASRYLRHDAKSLSELNRVFRESVVQSTTMPKRAASVETFQHDESVKVAVLSITAAGTGCRLSILITDLEGPGAVHTMKSWELSGGHVQCGGDPYI